jgi:hypothetical protein
VRYSYIILLAWLQVTLISANTWLISKSLLMPAVMCGFAISFVWTFNVKRVAFGGMCDRLCYSFGACLGTATGLLAAPFIAKWCGA